MSYKLVNAFFLAHDVLDEFNLERVELLLRHLREFEYINIPSPYEKVSFVVLVRRLSFGKLLVKFDLRALAGGEPSSLFCTINLGANPGVFPKSVQDDPNIGED